MKDFKGKIKNEKSLVFITKFRILCFYLNYLFKIKFLYTRATMLDKIKLQRKDRKKQLITITIFSLETFKKKLRVNTDIEFISKLSKILSSNS